MNRIFLALILILLSFVGISLIMFVLRMIFFTPSPMGMMMGSTMMFHHMGLWLSRTFLFIIFFVIILLVVWAIYPRKKNTSIEKEREENE